MSKISVDYDILNQKQTPAFYASSLATRPAFGFPGRIFIDTDTPSSGIYRDTGSAWVQVADPGAGTTGTLQQVTTNGNTTTLGISVNGINFNAGAGTGTLNTAIGSSALGSNTTGAANVAVGYQSMIANTTGGANVAIGRSTLSANTTGSNNTSLGSQALKENTTAGFNTGIGTASIQNNTTGANNTAVGYGTLTQNTTASFNTAIGGNSLTANTTGASNTAIGYNSLAANTTADNNTAIGLSALQSNTTGGGNTAIGYQSQLTNTTGVNNNSLGFNSLRLNTTGGNNVALGTNALQSNTTASDNTAIGNNSLNGNTTGTSNTAVGSSSLIANTTGSSNTAIGSSSLAANTTGTQNTALGFSSLNANTTGSYNTSLGVVSLLANITGSNNTAIGNGALASTTAGNNTAIGQGSLTAVTTGQFNTAIGSSSGGSITTGSNNTILGNYTGTTTLASNIVLSDGAGNVRLFSDANGLIGINQAVGSTIGGQLDIHTTQTYALVLNGLSTSNAYTAFSNASVGKWRIGNTYNAGANTFDIYNLGTSSNAISILSTNNFVGIGTSSPLSKLTVWTPTIQSNAGVWSNCEIALHNSTSVGDYSQIGLGYAVGTTNSAAYIGLKSTSSAANGKGDLVFGTRDVTTDTAPTERTRITSTGNVLIGSTTDDATAKLQVNGEIRMYGSTLFRGMSSNTLQLCGGTSSSNIKIDGSVEVVTIDTNGVTRLNIASTGVTTISNLAGTGSRAVLADASGNLSAPVSDISVKENISTIGYGLNEILKMNPVWFDYIDEYKNYGKTRQNGNIAQEMESIIPEAVFTTPSTGKMGINYDQLHAVYIKAIQELKAEIDALKNN